MAAECWAVALWHHLSPVTAPWPPTLAQMSKTLYYSLPKAQDQVCITFTNNIKPTTGVQDTAATITVNNQSNNKARLGSVECRVVHQLDLLTKLQQCPSPSSVLLPVCALWPMLTVCLLPCFPTDSFAISR
jgi:hypothetical protein